MALALALEVWPWQKIQGQNIGRLHNALLTSIQGDWSELYFKIHVPYLLTMGNRDLVRVLEKKQHFITVYCNPLHYGIPLASALSVLAFLTSLTQTWGVKLFYGNICTLLVGNGLQCVGE